MKKIILLLLLGSLFSCNKSLQSNPKTSKGLLVATWTNYTSNDTTIDTYEYDSKNRMSKRTETDKFSTSLYSYQYDNDDDLTGFTITSGNTSEAYHIIYANGQPAYSTVGSDTTTFCSFTVQENKVTKIYYPAQGYYDTVTYTGNNIATLQQVPQSFFFPSYDVYGTKNGPYKNSRFKWYLNISGTSNHLMEYDENDMVSNGQSSQSTQLIPIVYNDQGYPVKMTYSNGAQINVFTYKTAN